MHTLQASEIRGTWTPLFLQIKEHSVIDFGFIDEQIARISTSGVSGIYVGTNTSEFFNLTFTEFCRIAERFANCCKRHEMPYQIGACHVHPYESLERVAVSADLQPAAIQLILPDWVKTDRRGMLRFMKGCAKNARGCNLVLHNPNKEQAQLTPEDFLWLANEIPELQGVYSPDGGEQWFEQMQPVMEKVSVFVSGDRLATGLAHGAKGTYSTVAGMNPCAAQSWHELTLKDPEAGMDLERRIQQFMAECVHPFALNDYPEHARNKFLAVTTGWCEGLHQRLRWPYTWVEDEHIKPVQERGIELIPEFFQNII